MLSKWKEYRLVNAAITNRLSKFHCLLLIPTKFNGSRMVLLNIVATTTKIVATPSRTQDPHSSGIKGGGEMHQFLTALVLFTHVTFS